MSTAYFQMVEGEEGQEKDREIESDDCQVLEVSMWVRLTIVLEFCTFEAVNT